MAALATTATSSSTLAKSGAAATPRPSVPSLTRVTVRDGQTVAINDYVYLSTPWAPGAGEPYIIARVMEFVLASSSRKGAQALASSSGTLQVRVNLYLRQRDITHRTLHDPRLLLATMHADVFALENIRGVCSVRHRDLIGDAPAVSAWKRKDDHFYYHQLYDRFQHRSYDVIPTSRIRNAPDEVLATLRQRYSFVVAEIGLAVDLCGPLRACTVCDKWSASAESVRCDTCKQFFHMGCLKPPLAAKPAKGYSWTCAPCSKQREQEQASPSQRGQGMALDAVSSDGHTPSHAADGGVSRLPGNQGSLRVGPGTRGRGRGRGGWQGGRRPHLQNGEDSASMSRETTPQLSSLVFEQRTADDTKGVRCFNCWPYRYFGEHTVAQDVLDPDDSIFPRATARLGVKFQAMPVTWEEQQALGLGVHAKIAQTPPPEATTSADEPPVKIKRPPGRPPKKKKEEPPAPAQTLTQRVATESSTTTTGTAATSVEGTPEVQMQTSESEPERGSDASVEVVFRPGIVPGKLVDKYISICRQQFPSYKDHLGLLKRSLQVLMRLNGDGGKALAQMSESTSADLEVASWSGKELKALDKTVLESGAEMRALKRAIPTKTPAEIVRQFYYWKCNSLKEQFEASKKAAAEAGEEKTPAPAAEQSTRAVSPSRSLWDDNDAASSSQSNGNVSTQHVCKMCATTTSDAWYKGPYSWVNRRLCSSCGVYWRKYAAETPSEIVTRKREAAAEEAPAASAPSAKVTRVSRSVSLKGSSAVATPHDTAARVAVARRKPAHPCVMCKGKEPTGALRECHQCSLCVHQGCYGLVDGEMASDVWYCDACANEHTLDAALVPRCILCPMPEALPIQPPPEALGPPRPRKPGRPPKNPPPQVPADPVVAAAAAKYRAVVTAPLTDLDAFKPTECNNWVHLNCALYIPELVFSDPNRMRLVEGAGSLPLWRHEATCDLCKTPEGACVSCAEPSCKRTFHVSCASQQRHFTMGIDITPVKSSRRDAVPVTKFGAQSGHMTAVIYCDTHKDAAEARSLINMSEVDKESEPITTSKEALSDEDANTKEASPSPDVGHDGVSPPISAAHLFAVTHKGVPDVVQGSNALTLLSPDAGAHPLLRRAKRVDFMISGAGLANGHDHRAGRRSIASSQRASTLDRDEAEKEHGARGTDATARGAVPNGVHAAEAKQAPARPHCVRCATVYSPFWFDVPANVEEEKSNGSGGEDDASEMASSTDRPVPAWLESLRSTESTTTAAAESSDAKPLLCVRCRHAVRPPLQSL